MPRCRIESLLTTIVTLASGCGGAGAEGDGDGDGETDGGPPFEACFDSPRLSGLSPTEPYDGFELRQACQGPVSTFQLLPSGMPDPPPPTPFGALEVFGTSCARDACAEQVAIADARVTIPVPTEPRWNCATYLIAMRDDQLIFSAAFADELLPVLGTIDTLAEARLFSSFKWASECAGVRVAAGGFEIMRVTRSGGCQAIIQEHRYRLQPNAESTWLAIGEARDSGSCVGRVPGGLLVAQTAEASGLGGYFARASELEAASVAAFAIARREFARHSAPVQLLRRLRRASLDEVRHAQQMAALARRFGAAPRPVAIQGAPTRELEAVACENARDGCVFETWGALLGMYQARSARDAAVRRAMSAVARDEIRHAELSWDLSRWLESRLAPPARARVERARQAAIEELRAGLAVDDADHALAAGLPARAERQRLWSALAQKLWNLPQHNLRRPSAPRSAGS
jgi:hypothetical protein